MRCALGCVEDDEEVAAVTDRDVLGSSAELKQTVADGGRACWSIVTAFAPDISLKYNKFYIGLAT
jgi:hypothetical protein